MLDINWEIILPYVTSIFYAINFAITKNFLNKETLCLEDNHRNLFLLAISSFFSSIYLFYFLYRIISFKGIKIIDVLTSNYITYGFIHSIIGATAAFLLFSTLQKIKLSIGLPIIGSCLFILNLFFSFFYFKEKLNFELVLACFFIITGIIIFSKNQ